MELSQKALAMLFLGGIPIGAALQLIYAITDVGALHDGPCKKMLCNAKDFACMLIAGIAVVITVYYVNNGEFRYLVVAGMACGFAASHLLLAKPVIHARNAVMRLLRAPAAWMWAMTFGRLQSSIRARTQQKGTQARVEQLMLLASNGFEN